MASLTTEHCAHDFFPTYPTSPVEQCVYCNVERLAAVPVTREMAALLGAELREPHQGRTRFLTNADPGDEDRQR